MAPLGTIMHIFSSKQQAWTRGRAGLRALFAALCAAWLLAGPAAAQSNAADMAVDPPGAAVTGPVRLQQDPPRREPQPANAADARSRQPGQQRERATESALPRYVPGEFERFVQRQARIGHPAAPGPEGERTPPVEVRRFGADLMADYLEDRDATLSPLVPPDYLISPGDEVLLTMWGSVEADLRLTVDRTGRIHIPRVGSVLVSGLRHAELEPTIARRAARVFRNFQLAASLGQLRGIRVFVTGFVVKPGTYTLNNLSTVLAALMQAGGPAAAGSFRAIDLRRNGKLLATFDLYDLLLKGDRSADVIVQAGDVVHVRAVGTQVGVIGSVNKPAVIELKPGETVADALHIAGGFSAVADRGRLAVERLQDRTGVRVAQLTLPADLAQPLSQGDVLRAFSVVDIALPTQRQSKRVRVEGEVLRPSEYVLPEGSTIADALSAAGGLTPNAYVYATEFTRESVRLTQQENYNRALRDLETDLARASSSRRVSTADEAAGETARAASNARLLSRLRELQPNGRIVLEMAPSAASLPNLALEDGDRLYLRARPNTVSVFGSVFNAGSYLYSDQRTVGDYLRLAGGPTRGADQKSVFVVRPNGTVVSELQRSTGWFNRETLVTLSAQPGDSVFVPEEMDKATFMQTAKDWGQIVSQFGLGIAALIAITR